MDTKQLIQDAKARFARQESKDQLREKYQSQLMLPYQGGMWMITTELLIYLKMAPVYTIMVDLYKNPIRVNTRDFYDTAQLQYQQVMEAWHAEHQKLQQLR